MAITNLTGTKWLLNENPSALYPNATYNINFSLINEPTSIYTSMTSNDDGGKPPFHGLYYNSTLVGSQIGYYLITDDKYRSIEITGGTDVTNTTLINWLEANATQIIESSTSPKIFAVGDVLPATTQLRITDINGSVSIYNGGEIFIKTDSDAFLLVNYYVDPRPQEAKIFEINGVDCYNSYSYDWESNHFITIDTSSWSLSKRTVSYVDGYYNFDWEDLNVPSGYSITFEENGGTTVTDLTEQTALPNPLPTPTKSGYTFLGWYYESNFTTQAYANDTLSANVTLYAKWEVNTYTVTFESNGGTTISDIEEATELPTPLPTPTKANNVFAGWYLDSSFTQKANAGDALESSVTLYAKWYSVSGWFSDVADAIRTKDGTAETIEVVEFPDRIANLPSPVELTQTAYDNLNTKDSNTYYLIVEEA